MAEAAQGVPVILYDVPGRTGVTLEETTIQRLSEVPNITALKDATYDVERAGRLAQTTDLDILSGDDAITIAMMRNGAKGVVSVAANVVPDLMARLCAELDESLQETLAPLFAAMFLETNPIPVKYAVSRLRGIRNELRLPLVPLRAAHQAEVESALQAVRS
jgi:4-hydroxy-tetrahydrodipicolinate synthase